ncbi:hypothetical protein BN1723_003968 [Verticillium longisporum]|uniref:Heat shock protein 70 n=2 Tax=Verticillium longisporum TaxID=100787 RepID=A0A0G4MGK4_VERLO|nr:hypothetical protein BN1723_003968 [Verticillium longisporum]
MSNRDRDSSGQTSQSLSGGRKGSLKSPSADRSRYANRAPDINNLHGFRPERRDLKWDMPADDLDDFFFEDQYLLMLQQIYALMETTLVLGPRRMPYEVSPWSIPTAMEGNIFAPVVPRGNTVPCIKKRTFTTVADNQQTVQFPVYQGERVNCEDNTSLGEFTLAPIPPMRAAEAVLECVFEVDVNGILKVTATEKTSGRSANITISNSVGKLSSHEIENMINDAEKFKSSDEAFSKKFEAKQQLESYIGRVEEIISDPTLSLKLKRGQKDKIEQQVSEAMAKLEITDASAEDLKKQELALKRLVTKAMSSR